MMDCTSQRQANIQTLLGRLTEESRTVLLEDQNGRRELLSIARNLCHELETPMEAIFRMVVIQPVLYMAIRTSVELDLFTIMAKEESCPKTSTHLASLVGAEPVLLGRLMKQMAAMDFIREVGPDQYDLNDVSKSLLIPSHRDGIPFCHDVLLPGFRATTQYLVETQYRNPSDIRNTPFQLGNSTKKTFFEYLAANPAQNHQFNNFMGMYATDRPRWLDAGHFPIRKVLGEEAKINEDNPVLLVDVGGGKGHDLALFQKMYSDLPGGLVLQDIPYVIEQAGALPAGIEAMPYDFFTPNPIKGAKAYYFHSVLHGWPDDKCLEILRTVKEAMKPGYSKLLINEIVIADQGAHHLSTSMDLLMMTVVAAEERTENSWSRLLKLAGLKLVKIWNFEIGTESVIEAELE